MSKITPIGGEAPEKMTQILNTVMGILKITMKEG